MVWITLVPIFSNMRLSHTPNCKLSVDDDMVSNMRDNVANLT